MSQLVHQNGERLFVTTIDISNRFGKRHDNVMQAVRQLECSPDFRRLNFKESSYNNSQNKLQPMFEITRDGFVFLCMGFTGPQAALWKERYIQAFNDMESALRSPGTALEVASARFFIESNKDLAREVGALRDQLRTQQNQIISLFERVDGARLGHLRASAQLARVLERERRQLIVGEKREARETIIALEAEGVPRPVIAARTGRTYNHIRQVVWQARRDGQLPPAQGELSLGGAL